MEAAFRATDRGRYVTPQYKAEAYVDSPLPIGFGQTISAPQCVARLMEYRSLLVHY